MFDSDIEIKYFMSPQRYLIHLWTLFSIWINHTIQWIANFLRISNKNTSKSSFYPGYPIQRSHPGYVSEAENKQLELKMFYIVLLLYL